jgi:hypothetical protein
MRLTLHAGLPETGASTLQRTFFAAKRDLAGCGLCYPGTESAHHEVARHAQAAVSWGKRHQRSLHRALESHGEEARVWSAPHLFLSSERLFRMNAAGIGRLGEAIARCLPEVRKTRVLVYVREPVGLAASLGLQQVKAGRLRLAELCADPWRLALAEGLRNLAHGFGRRNMVVRSYAPGDLADGGILADVLLAAGVKGMDGLAPVAGAGTLLTAAGAEVADALVTLRPVAERTPSRQRRYRRLLEAVDGPPFVLPMEVQARVIAAAQPDLDWVNRVFGLSIRPVPVAAPATRCLSEAEALRLATEIVAAAEGETEP